MRVVMLAVAVLSAAPGVQQGANPAQPPGGRGGQMALSSPTPLAEIENLHTYPVPPAGFNVARENVPHGEVTVVEDDSKTLCEAASAVRRRHHI